MLIRNQLVLEINAFLSCRCGGKSKNNEPVPRFAPVGAGADDSVSGCFSGVQQHSSIERSGEPATEHFACIDGQRKL